MEMEDEQKLAHFHRPGLEANHLYLHMTVWMTHPNATPQLILGDPKTVLPIETADRRRHTDEKHLKEDFPMS